MRVNDDYKQWNAASQISDPTSVHSFWKEALRIRKSNDILVHLLLDLCIVRILLIISA